MIQPGLTEAVLAWKLEQALHEAGSTGLAFPIIVASGPNGAMAHHTPGQRGLQAGDSIIVDMGAEFSGYKSDLTRTVYYGLESNHQFRTIYDVVEKAHQTALQNMKAGMTGKAVDNLARSVISEAGFAEEFGHSLGHGVGLDVHEGPRLSFHERH